RLTCPTRRSSDLYNARHIRLVPCGVILEHRNGVFINAKQNTLRYCHQVGCRLHIQHYARSDVLKTAKLRDNFRTSVSVGSTFTVQERYDRYESQVVLNPLDDRIAAIVILAGQNRLVRQIHRETLISVVSAWSEWMRGLARCVKESDGPIHPLCAWINIDPHVSRRLDTDDRDVCRMPILTILLHRLRNSHERSTMNQHLQQEYVSFLIEVVNIPPIHQAFIIIHHTLRAEPCNLNTSHERIKIQARPPYSGRNIPILLRDSRLVNIEAYARLVILAILTKIV